MKTLQAVLLVSLAAVLVSGTWINHPNCGIRGTAPSALVGPNLGIKNGQTAFAGEFPWIVAILIHGGDGENFRCAGSILNEQWILTAAKCKFANNDYTVIAGVHNLSDTTEKSRVRRQMARFIVHPLYYKENFDDYDVALIKLDKPLDLSQLGGPIGPVCLPKAGEGHEEHSGDVATLAGWGDQLDGDWWGNGRVEHQVLQKTNLTVSSNEFCRLDLWRYWPRLQPEISKLMICANGRKVTGACLGDNGGPLTVAVDGRWQIYGITSFGPACDSGKTTSGVYTRVTEFVDWIEKTIKEN